jgi:Clostridial hydrophobic W
MSETASAEPKKSKIDQPGQITGQSPDPSNRIAELQVSAHLMTLETGLFCVFQSPGSPPPDPSSGLPGVRITPAPGIGGRPETVSVTTFRDDGWLDGTAALVRVPHGTAQILVTIYQHKGKDAAPRLQVLRLSGEAGALLTEAGLPVTPVGPAAPKVKAAKPDVRHPEIMAHIQRMGDVGCMLGEWLGAKGSRQWVEGFGMAPANGIAAQDVEYQAVLGRDWLSPWVESGKFCGSRGMALPLLGLRVRLKGAAAKAFECSYSATFIDGTAIGPVSAGEACEADSLAALEAFQIVIHPRSAGVAPAKPPLKLVVSKPAAKSPRGKDLPASKAAARAKAKPKNGHAGRNARSA